MIAYFKIKSKGVSKLKKIKDVFETPVHFILALANIKDSFI